MVEIPDGGRVDVRRAARPVRIARVHAPPSATGWWRSSACRSADSATPATPVPGTSCTPAGTVLTRGIVNRDGRSSPGGGTECRPTTTPERGARGRRAAGTGPADRMRIRGLGAIDDVTLELGSGLTVVTGETGAGKTMVVTGLTLLFGGRADQGRVRANGRAGVEGRLALPSDSPVWERAADAGADPDDDGSLILARTVSAEGRSRAFLGGRSVPVGVVAELAEEAAGGARPVRPAAAVAARRATAGAGPVRGSGAPGPPRPLPGRLPALARAQRRPRPAARSGA